MSANRSELPHLSLRDAARACFADRYGKPKFHEDKQLSKHLNWVPSLRFTLHGHINVFVEPSDSGPYPLSLALLYAQVNNYHEPISVYSVCHEAALETASGRTERKRLKEHCFGLVTVDHHGVAEVQFTAIPIVQAISETEFKNTTRGLPRGILQRTSEAFEDYASQPVNGVKTLSEVVEGMIRKAGRDSAAKKDGISSKDSKQVPAVILDALHEKHEQARAGIGGARNFISECRNLTHHWPRNKNSAYEKYANCRNHFLQGLNTIQTFRRAMKNVGLSGNLANK